MSKTKKMNVILKKTLPKNEKNSIGNDSEKTLKYASPNHRNKNDYF